MWTALIENSPAPADAVVPPIRREWRLAPVSLSYWHGPCGIVHAEAATAQMLTAYRIPFQSSSQIVAAAPRSLFEQAGLAAMLDLVYGGNPAAALHALFPAIRVGQWGRVPRAYWQGEVGRTRAQAAVRRMLGDLGWGGLSPAEVAARVTAQTFIRYGLSGLLQQVYERSPFIALADLFPELRPWQMAKVPQALWQGPAGAHRAIQATRWMLHQMDLATAPAAHIAAQVTQETFRQHGLGGMLQQVYAGSPFAALAAVVPDLQPWQMGSRVPQGYWQGPTGREHARAALRWLIAAQGLEGARPARVAAALTPAVFAAARLDGMLQRAYAGSIFAALADLWPQQPPWRVGGRVPQGYWQGPTGREHARAALCWLVTTLEIDLTDPACVRRALDLPTFVAYGLSGMLRQVYRDNRTAAVADLFGT